MKTYVEYNLPDINIPAGRPIVEEVTSRDIALLNIPQGTRSFLFYDSPIVSDNIYDTLDEQHNASDSVYVAERLLSREEARDAFKEDPLSKDDRFAHAVTTTLFNHSAAFGLSSSGCVIFIGKNDAVITPDKQRLHPVKDDISVLFSGLSAPLCVKNKPFLTTLKKRGHHG